MQSNPLKMVNALDQWSILAGARFILASIVAINHLGDFVPLGYLGFIPLFGAFEAILGFLLISGYSISASYTKQPDGFLMRRIMRLYPIYLAAIAISYLVFVFLKDPLPQPLMLIANALFLNQLVTKTSFVGPAWSLSLEFWLYCLTPFLMLRSKPFIRWVIFGSFTSYVIYTVLRTLSHVPYYSGVGFGANLVLLSFIWVAGLRLARSKGGDKTALRDIGLIMVGYMAVDVVIQFGHRFKHHAVAEFFQHDSIGFAARSATLFFVFLIFKYLVIPPRLSVRRSWFLRFLGDVSYPLYLLHGAIYAIIAHLGLKIPALFYIIAVLVSALVYWSLDFYSKKRHQQLDPDKPTQPIPDIKTKLAPELL